MKLYWVPLCVAVFLLQGCNRGVESKEAVLQGVIDHLSSRSKVEVEMMDVEVTSVAFHENEADVTVRFRPKGGGPESGMEMRYTLEQQGSRWQVKDRPDAGSMPPPGAMGEGIGRLPESQAPAGGLPAGHPPIGDDDSLGAGKK